MEQLGDQRRREDDGDVQRRERGDALGRLAGERLVALVDQRLLQRRGARLGQRRVEVGGDEDRPQRREHEVGDDAERPVEAERGDVPEPGDRVRRRDQGGAERDRHEGEEEQVHARQQVRGDAGAQQVVQERAGVVAEEQVAVERQQGRVVVLVGQEGEEALEVPVRQVGDVERHQAEADGAEAAAVPALARDGGQRDADRPGALDRARDQVGDDEEGERAEQQHDAPAEHLVRVPHGQPVGQGYDGGRKRHGEGDPERRAVPAPGQRVGAAVLPDGGVVGVVDCGGGHRCGDCAPEM